MFRSPYECEYSAGFPKIPLYKQIAGAIAGAFGWTFLRVLRSWTTVKSVDLGRIEELAQEAPVILYTWHKHGTLAYFALRSRPIYSKIWLLCHDRFNSLMWWIGTRDVKFLAFSFDSKIRVREQIVPMIKKGRVILAHPDSGGPYEKMKPGTLAIAQASGAYLLPVVVDCKKVWHFGGKKLDHRFPKPGAVVELKVGEPLKLSTTDLETQRLHAEEALQKLIHEGAASVVFPRDSLNEKETN